MILTGKLGRYADLHLFTLFRYRLHASMPYSLPYLMVTDHGHQALSVPVPYQLTLALSFNIRAQNRVYNVVLLEVWLGHPLYGTCWRSLEVVRWGRPSTATIPGLNCPGPVDDSGCLQIPRDLKPLSQRTAASSAAGENPVVGTRQWKSHGASPTRVLSVYVTRHAW